MNYIKKTIYLPSGGVEYSPLVFLDKIDASYVFMRSDHFSNESLFDTFASTLNHYCKLPVPVGEMYTSDIYYLWSLMATIDLGRKFFTTGEVCDKCKEEYSVSVYLEKLDVLIGNKFNGFTIPKANFTIEELNANIILRPRKVLDNYAFSANIQQYMDRDGKETNTVYRYLNFIVTQIESIKIDGVDINQQLFFDVIKSTSLDCLFELYNKVKLLNKSFGIYDNFKSTCPKCGHKNEGWLYDDLSYSQPFITGGTDGEQFKNLYMGLLQEARYPCNTFDDGFKRPLRYNDFFYNAMKEMDFQQGTIMM